MKTVYFAYFRAFLTTWLLFTVLLSACAAASPTPHAATSTVQPLPAPSPMTTATIALPTSLPALQAKPEILKNISLQFWHPYSGDLAKRLQVQVDDFNQHNTWGIQVLITAPGSRTHLDESVRLTFNGNTRPDVVIAPPEALTGWQVLKANSLVDLSGYISDGTWGYTQAEISDFYPVFWQAENKSGQQFGIPALRRAHFLIYNSTWAGKLGFSQPPQTPQDFQTQTCKAAKANATAMIAEKYGTGGWIEDSAPLTTLSWLYAFDAPTLMDESSPVYSFDTPASEQALTFLQNLVGPTCIWVAREPTPYGYFARQQALVYSAASEDLLEQSMTQNRLKSMDEWTVLPYPTVQGKTAQVVVSGEDYALLTSSPERQLAGWLLIQWLSAAEHQAELVRLTATLPVQRSSMAALSDFAVILPQWKTTVTWMDKLQPAPRLAAWHELRMLLQDSTWQIFNQSPKPIPIADILKQIDQTYLDLQKKP